MFCDVVENGITNTDKLLICLAIILFLTIIWTILIGIMYKMKSNDVVVKKTNKFLLDDDEDEEKVVVKNTTVKAKKTTTKKTKKTKKATTKKTRKTNKKSNTVKASAVTPIVKEANTNKEVYVKVRFYRTDRDLIYVAPENVILKKGDKIKVRTDEGDIRTATVAQGNYLREKYKTYEYQTLELVDYNK